MLHRFGEEVKVVSGLVPSSDVYAGGVASDVVNMKNYDRATFVLFQTTAGTNTGVGTITMEACTLADATGNTAIPFRYRKATLSTSVDTMGALTAVAATGVATTANLTGQCFIIEVDAAELPAGKPFLRMAIAETVNDPVIGAVLVFLHGPRYAGSTLPTAIA